jgi:5'(3')-deoxyribonucleotidase
VSIIAVDLDGTSYQYESAYCYMARTYLGLNIKVEDWDSWDFPVRTIEREDLRWWMANEAPKLGLYRYGHIMKGAIVALRKMSEQHELVVVTHRPRVAVSDTLAWLVYADLPLAGVHILSDGQAKSSVVYDLLIDDRPENIEDAIGHGRQGVVFDQPWNQNYPALYRATWEGMEDVVAQALG